MDRFRLSHILLCALISSCLVSLGTAQDRDAGAQSVPARHQKWLDEDARYIISDKERTDFARLTTDQQRDKFVEDFRQRRNLPSGTRSRKNTIAALPMRMSSSLRRFPDGKPTAAVSTSFTARRMNAKVIPPTRIETFPQTLP